MNIFQANEFVTTLPAPLKDRTVNIFCVNEDGPSEFGVVVARERPKDGEDLDRYVARQHTVLLQRLPVLRVLRREDIKLDNERASLVDYTWQSTEGRMFQRQVTVFTRVGGLAIIITATCKDPLKREWDDAFNEILRNFRLRS